MTPEQKARIEHAAALEGRSTGAFMVEAAYTTALNVIRERGVIKLTPEESVRFAEIMLNPPEPSDELLAVARRYQAFLRGRDAGSSG
jgi:uncharacterized protein (DUF1778 family)